jgi:hypothetical protein
MVFFSSERSERPLKTFNVMLVEAREWWMWENSDQKEIFGPGRAGIIADRRMADYIT